VGKKPKQGVPGTDHQTRLIQLRREMREAIDREDYEQASKLRDEIRRIEKHRTK
jgi:protein arginine kinase activator